MAHIHEKYDYTTSGFVIHENKLLLVKHIKLGSWLQPGGHIELDEHPIEALFREIQEETGLSEDHLQIIENTHIPVVYDGSNISLPVPYDINVHPFPPKPGHFHIDLRYVLLSDTAEVVQNPAENNGIGWFTADQLDTLTPMIDEIRSMGKQALAFAAAYAGGQS
jgi:8-oxo-dGTP pyrophosphatase MutT (NUDIX family)